jgi:hypothetical protein
VGDSSETVLLASSSRSSSRLSHITLTSGVLALSGKKLGGSRYGDLVALARLAVFIVLLASAPYDGRMGDRHVRLNDAWMGDAAVDMAPLMKLLENRLGGGAEDSGGGAIARDCVVVRPVVRGQGGA